MPADAPVATLIGDLVASRTHVDRGRLQATARETLAWANEQLRPVQALEMTLGDEFQGTFATPADVVEASLFLRLALLTHTWGADSRYGLGWGEIQVFNPSRSPVSQDGPGWWAARGAIERVKEQASRSSGSYVRTFFASQPRAKDPWAGAMDAFLLMRDATVDRMSPRQHRLMLGLINGRTQDDLAKQESITQGAISQALRRSGALAIIDSHQRLREEGAS